MRRRARERFTFANKVVVISGGGRGLGLQLARESAARGATLGLFARSAAELDAAAAELRAAGTRVATRVCDVRDGAAVDETVRRFEDELGSIDVLFNVAGIIGVGPVEAFAVEDFRESLDINFLGAVRAAYAVLPAMRRRRAGRIVNITSLGAAISIPHMLPYCASKFALLAFSEGLRSEVARDGIEVVTVIPGLMRTGSPPNATFVGQPEREYAMFALSDATPLTSISVERAAREIVDGAERGRRTVVVTWQAKVALLARAMTPGLVAAILRVGSRFLPGVGPVPRRQTGAQSGSPVTESPLTALSRHASQTQNETIAPLTP